jgi:hypothetical protein
MREDGQFVISIIGDECREIADILLHFITIRPQ